MIKNKNFAIIFASTEFAFRFYLPVHILQRYCGPDTAFSPLPKLTSAFKRSSHFLITSLGLQIHLFLTLHFYRLVARRRLFKTSHDARCVAVYYFALEPKKRHRYGLAVITMEPLPPAWPIEPPLLETVKTDPAGPVLPPPPPPPSVFDPLAPPPPPP